MYPGLCCIDHGMDLVCVAVVGGGVRAGASGPDCVGAGTETHAETLQIVGQTQHEPYPAESPLFLH